MAENDLYQLNIEGTIYSNLVVNTFGFVQTSTTAGFLGQLLIDTFQAGAYTAYKTMLSANYTTNMFRAFDIVPGTAATAEEVITTSNIGIGAAGAGANQIAALISWRTNRSGKSYRGRSYFPAIPAGEYGTGGNLSSTELTAMTNFKTAMMTTFGPGSSGPFRMVVISKVQNGVTLAQPIGTLVVDGINRSVVATQRRRRLGVGA